MDTVTLVLRLLKIAKFPSTTKIYALRPNFNRGCEVWNKRLSTELALSFVEVLSHMLKVACTFFLVLASAASASEWETLRDDKFGYVLPIPADYSLTMQPKSGASRIFHNPNGDLLLVWGANLGERELCGEMERRQREDISDGWEITYTRLTAEWASFSAVIGDQIRYVRGIKYCGDRAAFFLIDYAREDKALYDPIVTHMVRHLRPTAVC